MPNSIGAPRIPLATVAHAETKLIYLKRLTNVNIMKYKYLKMPFCSTIRGLDGSGDHDPLQDTDGTNVITGTMNFCLRLRRWQNNKSYVQIFFLTVTPWGHGKSATVSKYICFFYLRQSQHMYMGCHL